MQSVKINHIEYHIPVCWDDVSYIQAITVLKHINDKGKQLETLSGIPMWVIDKLTDIQAAKLFELISFTENLEVFESVDVKEEYKDFDFGTVEYGTAEYCRKVLSEAESGFEGIILAIYKLVKIDISKEPFLQVIGTANFFLSKLLSSLIVMPNLAKMSTALNRSKQDMSDYKILEALQRTLNLQGVEQSAEQ